MKKISRSDLKGLSKMFPVYSEEAMRKIVGGAPIDDLISLVNEMCGYGFGYSFIDNNGNALWFSSYNSFNNAYSAYKDFGYVDFAHPGYFYFDDGKGGYIQYYNSVFGFGPNETIPTTNLCFFAAIARITGTSISQVFTDYKNMGYAYNAELGPYASEIGDYIKAKKLGSEVSIDQVGVNGQNLVPSGQSLMGFATVQYVNEQKQELHAEIITSQNGDFFQCIDAISGETHLIPKSQFYKDAYYVKKGN